MATVKSAATTERKATKAARRTVDAKIAFRKIGCSDSAGYQAIREGVFPLPIIKIGRRVFVPSDALDRLLNGDAA